MNTTNQTENQFKKWFIRIFWGSLAGIVTIALITFLLIGMGVIGYMPNIEELQNPNNRYASEIYSADMQSMGRFYRQANRVNIQYEDISPYLVDALIATEDARFFEHTGIDTKAIMRAVLKLGRAGGGSTLTQQLAKQIWSPQADNTFERALQKPIEWVIATKLERLYSKQQIISMYFNQFDFLYNAVGIQTASQVYFGVKPSELTLEQAATLVGMCKNPSLYNPVKNPKRATERRNVVLSQMHKYGYIDSQTCDSVTQIPLTVNFHSVDHKRGEATYFREFLRLTMTAKEPIESNYPDWNKEQYTIDKYLWDNNPLYGFCNKNTKSDGSHYDIYSDGLKIYTTLDSRMQRYAEESVNQQMRDLQAIFFREKKGRSYAPFARNVKSEDIDKIMNRAMRQTDRYRALRQQGLSEEQITQVFNTPTPMQVFAYNDLGYIDTVLSPMDSIRWNKHFLRCGFMAMEPHSGYVKAYVGGPDFQHFQYDMAAIGRRQVGSTVKPYLYTLAMTEGMYPNDMVPNQPVTIRLENGQTWTPRDSHGGGGMVSLTWGLQTSSNWIAAYLMQLFTPQQLAQLMKSFGIKGYINPSYSLCLGSCEVSLEEMVDAYTTFPNGGIRVSPLYVTRIEDNQGNVIASFTPQAYEVIDQESATKMIYMMQHVIDGGTGSRMRRIYGIKAPLAGKTGTTNNNSDGWFVCYSPTLVCGAWVGGEDRSIHFDYTAQGQGASSALPIAGLFLQKVYRDRQLGYSEGEQFDYGGINPLKPSDE